MVDWLEVLELVMGSELDVVEGVEIEVLELVDVLEDVFEEGSCSMGDGVT